MEINKVLQSKYVQEKQKSLFGSQQWTIFTITSCKHTMEIRK